ncbi:MAG: hypothetical protein IIT97_03765, partial [Mycoplasmataceae bacterium]|nr:hypothetical protein [Mycoplasmataceae bacterium]
MKNLNPIQKARYILDHFKQYITSTYYLQNDVYYEKFKKELDNTEILKGPYISRSLEFKTTKTIDELIKEGIVHKDFIKLGDIDLYR